jgi:N6-adenosine-specific RNA methylase IME4
MLDFNKYFTLAPRFALDARQVAIESIYIGSRHRPVRNLQRYVDSIADVDLLQPVVVHAAGFLVAGARRLAAYRALGRHEVPVYIIDIDPELLVRAEHDENVVREPFTLSEMVAIKRALEPALQAEAKERRGGDHRGNPGNFPVLGRTRDQVAAGLGVSGKTLEAAEVIVVAAGAEPLKYADLVDKMDTTGKVNGAYKEFRKRHLAEKLTVAPAADVTGVYEVIVVDPPWPADMIQLDIRPNQIDFNYARMTEDELVNFDIPAMAADDCHLFCWATQKFLPMALRLIETWGFRYVCTFVWHKPGGFQPIDLPQYNCEFVLYGRRGSPSFVDTKAFPTCFEAPRREHSRKPDAFYEMVKRVTAGKRIDVFSREARDGFAQYGNEIEKFSLGLVQACARRLSKIA